MTDNDRDLAHEADMRALQKEQLIADCSDDDGIAEYDSYFDEECDYCQGTGTDKWCDDILECPVCHGMRL